MSATHFVAEGSSLSSVSAYLRSGKSVKVNPVTSLAKGILSKTSKTLPSPSSPLLDFSSSSSSVAPAKRATSLSEKSSSSTKVDLELVFEIDDQLTKVFLRDIDSEVTILALTLLDLNPIDLCKSKKPSSKKLVNLVLCLADKRITLPLDIAHNETTVENLISLVAFQPELDEIHKIINKKDPADIPRLVTLLHFVKAEGIFVNAAVHLCFVLGMVYKMGLQKMGMEHIFFDEWGPKMPTKGVILEKPDEEIARAYFMAAASFGHPQAAFESGLMCVRAKGGPLDIASAIKYFQQVVDNVNQCEVNLDFLLLQQSCAFFLAGLFAYGYDCPKDIDAAKKYLKLAGTSRF